MLAHTFYIHSQSLWAGPPSPLTLSMGTRPTPSSYFLLLLLVVSGILVLSLFFNLLSFLLPSSLAHPQPIVHDFLSLILVA